jgi:NADPH-dependent 2,4-dienoyl-CoA reductase/sulfur reductase-like enzyme
MRDFVIIGTGPAGLSAAATAAKAGAEVTIIGEDPRIGGQIFRQPVPPLEFRVPLVDVPDKNIFNELHQKLDETNVEFLSKTTAWGLSDYKTLIVNRKNNSRIKAKFFLIAEGAYEAPVPFPGWTLPGVTTLGGIQNLLKSQGVVPSGKVVIAGTGPLLFYTASQLVKNGVQVVAVLDASRFSKWFQWSFRLLRAPGVLMSGMNYYRILIKHKIPVYYSSIVSRALGEDRLREIEISRADRNWSPVPGHEIILSADYLCLNFGFIPSTQFTHLAGCKHYYDPDLRGWIPLVDSGFETSQEGIFVAGDGNGIGGVKTAVLEGESVGLQIAARLGYLESAEAEARIKRVDRALRYRRWYSKFLREIYRFHPGLNDLLKNETLVCRCEEVTYKSLNEVLQTKPQDLAQIRILSRLGMGRCQGRFCYPTLLGLLAEDRKPAEMAFFDYRARPPLRQLPIEELINLK